MKTFSCLLIFIFPLIGLGQSDTARFEVIDYEMTSDPNVFLANGVGSYEFGGYKIDIGLMDNEELAFVQISDHKKQLMKKDSILSVSKFNYAKFEDLKIFSFVAFTILGDQRNKGTLFSIVNHNGSLKIYSIEVYNTASPIIVDGNIVTVESLKLKGYTIDLTSTQYQLSIIHSNLLDNDYSYLDTYAISDLIIENGGLFIEFATRAFGGNYQWYKGPFTETTLSKIILLSASSD